VITKGVDNSRINYVEPEDRFCTRKHFTEKIVTRQKIEKPKCSSSVAARRLLLTRPVRFRDEGPPDRTRGAQHRGSLTLLIFDCSPERTIGSPSTGWGPRTGKPHEEDPLPGGGGLHVASRHTQSITPSVVYL
jgi:hypothetical protein